MKASFLSFCRVIKELIPLMAAKRMLEEEELVRIEFLCNRVGELYPTTFRGNTITPKVHVLVFWVPVLAREKGTLGGLREDQLESKHAVGNALKRRYACIRSEKQKHLLMLQQDHLKMQQDPTDITKPIHSRKRRKGAACSSSLGEGRMPEKAAATSPARKKKEKEEKETVSEKTESKSKMKKSSKKEASPSPEASWSAVFEHVEDPDILEIRRRQEQEARELARRSRSRTYRRSGALAKMADYQMSQSLGEAAAGKTRKRSSEEDKSRKKSGEKKEDKSHPEMGSFVTRTSREVETNAKVFASKDEEEEREEEKEFEEYTPDINDILRLPERSEDGGKTKEEILDELDAEIGRRQREHEQEMVEVDKETVEVEREREERRRVSRRNAQLRDRLEEELGEEAVRAMFARSLTHLEGIRAGSVASRRHAAFHQSTLAAPCYFF